MPWTREQLEALPDGAIVNEKWKYTCEWCGRAYIEDVHPSRQDFRRCHRCFTGGRMTPMRCVEWSAQDEEKEE